MSQDISIKSGSFDDDGHNLRVAFVVHNPANRTRHVYSSVRALRYDAATRRLEVQLSDHGLIEPRELRGVPSAATLVLPQLTEVAPKSDVEVTLRLERTIQRIDAARSQEVLRFEVLPIYEATSVKLDVAWGESPFYVDPRQKHGLRQQLVDWSQGVAAHQLKVKPRARDDGGKGGGKGSEK